MQMTVLLEDTERKLQKILQKVVKENEMHYIFDILVTDFQALSISLR